MQSYRVLLPALGLTLAQAAATDGIWTGGDWNDEVNGVQNINGVLSGTTPLTQQRMFSASTLAGDVSSFYLTTANVEMIQSVFNEDQWNYVFPISNPLYDYHSFLKAAAKFPAFCLEGGSDLCKRDLATFFAHTTHECGQEQVGSIFPQWRQGFYYITENACTPAVGDEKCDYKSTGSSADWWPSSDGVQYYGRGPLQISWNYNYGQFSDAAYGDINVLLENPDLVQTDGYTAFSSALWFYMTPQAPKPSMHEIATYLYVPSEFDVTQGLGSVFGATTMVINGGLECTTEDGEESFGSKQRMSHYQNFLEYFELPAETDEGCALMGPFSDESSSNYSMSLDRNWDTTNECKLAPWFTQFGMFREDDYKSCVCYYYDPENPDCINGATTANDDEAIIVN